jgi:phosphate transport system permease protein
MSRSRERLGFGLLGITAAVVVLITLALFAMLVWRGAPALSWEFLTSKPSRGMTEGGILPAVLGTVYITFITALFSIPVGVAAAVYLVEYARPGKVIVVIRLAIRNLSGVPSIVYGLFGVALFVHGLGAGMSVLASGLTLGLLTLPWIITASEEALKTVPRDQRDGALAVGATHWEAIRTVVLPTAMPGILTGAVLGLARAAGETAPILFTGVTFSSPKLPGSVFDQFMALPYHLYILATQHHDIEAVRPLAYATALTLLMIVGVFTGSAAIVRARLRTRRGQ